MGSTKRDESTERLTVSEAEACRIIGVAPMTMMRMRRRGVGPRCVRVGRRVLYRRTEIDRWLGELESASFATSVSGLSGLRSTAAKR